MTPPAVMPPPPGGGPPATGPKPLCGGGPIGGGGPAGSTKQAVDESSATTSRRFTKDLPLLKPAESVSRTAGAMFAGECSRRIVTLVAVVAQVAAPAAPMPPARAAGARAARVVAQLAAPAAAPAGPGQPRVVARKYGAMGTEITLSAWTDERARRRPRLRGRLRRGPAHRDPDDRLGTPRRAGERRRPHQQGRRQGGRSASAPRRSR